MTNVAVGGRVAYAVGPLGGYPSGRLYPAERLVRLPDNLSFEDAATTRSKVRLRLPLSGSFNSSLNSGSA